LFYYICRNDYSLLLLLQAPVASPNLEVINGGYGIKNPLLSPEYNLLKEKGEFGGNIRV